MNLQPEELLAAMVRLAIKDATQSKNERLRDEALWWLWWVAPAVAERARLLVADEKTRAQTFPATGRV